MPRGSLRKKVRKHCPVDLSKTDCFESREKLVKLNEFIRLKLQIGCLVLIFTKNWFYFKPIQGHGKRRIGFVKMLAIINCFHIIGT